jgi:NAD(P)-dependent dehydrogenase (short-subunit alcohol dehydrogenase family)
VKGYAYGIKHAGRAMLRQETGGKHPSSAEPLLSSACHILSIIHGALIGPVKAEQAYAGHTYDLVCTDSGLALILSMKCLITWAGSIVNIASTSAFVAQPGFVPYSTSKGAVLQLTRCSALDLGCHKVRFVTAVNPLLRSRKVLLFCC